MTLTTRVKALEQGWTAIRSELGEPGVSDPSTVQGQVDLLRRDVGDFETRADMSNPPAELPNGDYNVAFRQRQLGEALDSVIALANSLAVRLAALEAAPPPAVQDPPPIIEPPPVVFLNRVEGDLVVTGRLVVGGEFSDHTKEATEATVQVLGQGNAEIYYEGNRGGTGPQLGGQLAVALVGIGGYEGNFHILQNYKGGGKFGGLPVDTNRPFSVIVLDNQGTLTGSRRYAGQDFYGNDWWITDDITMADGNPAKEGLRTGSVKLTTPMPGAKVQLAQPKPGDPYGKSDDVR